jgi:hypothetical protein
LFHQSGEHILKNYLTLFYQSGEMETKINTNTYIIGSLRKNSGCFLLIQKSFVLSKYLYFTIGSPLTGKKIKKEGRELLNIENNKLQFTRDRHYYFG